MASFQLSKDEYVSACFSMVKKRIIISTTCLVFVFASLGIHQAIKTGKPMIGLFFFVAIASIIIPFSLYLPRRKLRKLFDDQASFRESIEAEFDEMGIHYTHETGTNTLIWDRIKKWSENERFIYLYESDVFARIIPKRAISEKEDALIRAHTLKTKKV